jgi:chromate transporter
MAQIVAYFALLSLISVGGVNTIYPEMQRFVVAGGWVSAAEFTQLFAVSQAAPGPNILITALIGWKVAGLWGAVAALAAMCAPSTAVTWWASALWDRMRDAPWRAVIERSLVPVIVGLVLAGGYILATPAGLGWANALLAGTSAAVFFATRINPLWILAAGGALGAVLFG